MTRATNRNGGTVWFNEDKVRTIEFGHFYNGRALSNVVMFDGSCVEVDEDMDDLCRRMNAEKLKKMQATARLFESR